MSKDRRNKFGISKDINLIVTVCRIYRNCITKYYNSVFYDFPTIETDQYQLTVEDGNKNHENIMLSTNLNFLITNGELLENSTLEIKSICYRLAENEIPAIPVILVYDLCVIPGLKTQECKSEISQPIFSLYPYNLPLYDSFSFLEVNSNNIWDKHTIEYSTKSVPSDHSSIINVN